MRAFLAILLDPPLRDALQACVRALQAARPPARLKWVGDEQHHVTLHFLGEISEAQTEAVTRTLAAIPPAGTPLALTLGGLGAFPNLNRPATLWAGGQDEGGRIADLAASQGYALKTLGFEIDARPFTPHLTLARVPRDLDPAYAGAGHIALNNTCKQVGPTFKVGSTYLASQWRRRVQFIQQ